MFSLSFSVVLVRGSWEELDEVQNNYTNDKDVWELLWEIIFLNRISLLFLSL